jgi:hypothetical protein
MVRNLTACEDLMAALFSDVPQGAATSARAVKKLFLGYGKSGSNGLKQYILQRIPSAKRSVDLDGIIKEAETIDAQQAIKGQTKKVSIAEAKKELPKLEKELEDVTKVDPENPDPAWKTPELKKEMVDDILAKIRKYSNLMKEADGGGGPGIHDGKGGVGEWLKSTFSPVNPALTGLWNNLKKPKTLTVSSPQSALVKVARAGYDVPEDNKHKVLATIMVCQELLD